MHSAAKRVGRPRSEQARIAVLHAVDDLLIEVGYAAMTMKGIAERAGVGRQTVYRWWTTKAEILFEAVSDDARQDLAVTPSGDLRADVMRYLEALTAFLTDSTAGAGYRALLGEAQHDRSVAELINGQNVLFDTAGAVVAPGVARGADTRDRVRAAVAILTGSVAAWAMTGQDPQDLPLSLIADAGLAALDPAPA